MEASDTVGELIVLQEIDLEILRIKGELGELAAEVSGLNETVEALRARRTELTGKLTEADERVRRFQRAVEAGRTTLKRLETRSAAVSNMQQHFAVRSETDTARRNLMSAEEDQLAAMQEVETLREQLTGVEVELGAAEDALETRSAEVDVSRSGLESELESRTSKKKTQEGRLDTKTLRLYQSVSGGRKDSALACLTADGVCGRCYTAVPKQRQADIRAGRGLAICEGCGVILYPETSDA
ncbi:MAG: C4-type zinc ribbon domain-containing protein [Gemmatimonadetes bacterium]|nr:C4-type zinc ribbon domain-containing protein [Gemmatimonadota bacterium]